MVSTGIGDILCSTLRRVFIIGLHHREPDHTETNIDQREGFANCLAYRTGTFFVSLGSGRREQHDKTPLMFVLIESVFERLERIGQYIKLG